MAYTTIKKPSDYFNTLTWTGDGSASRNITGVGFQPDWVWGKCRNTTVSHALYDAVRGASNLLNSNTTSAEGTNAALNAFISDGFTVNSDSYLNGNSNTYVGWNWLASNTSGSSNTDGTISSTVSVNTTSGFSIVSYTGNGSAGATIGHGLSAPLGMVIVKGRDTSGNWRTFHKNLGTDQYINLDETGAAVTFSGIFQTNSFTNNVFSVGNHSSVNGSGGTFIAYCFAEKTGYSKFGSYTGNGSTDGTFIYTGFKPAFILSKKTNASGTHWTIWDNKRSSSGGGNAIDKILHPNNSNPDNTADDTDFLSNGFKLRATASGMNNSGDTYIYMAFAEEPLVGDNPATAR